MSRGIFSLNESYNEQVSGDWSTASDVWLIGSPSIVRESDVGYIVGGDSGSGPKLSTVERIDYSNDTIKATQRGSLSAGSYIPAGNSSITHAYFGGGENPTVPGPVSIIQRIDYSNDTAISTPRGSLSVKRSKLGGTGTIDYGYWAGGSSPSFVTTVDRLDYANDTAIAVAKGPLSASTFYTVGTGNQSHGYFHLGTTGANQSTIDRLDYSSDSTACVTKGPLTVARFATMAATNGNLYGYFVGGTSNPPDLSTVNRIDYSNDTATASSPAFLSGVQARGAGLGNSNSGWFGGGTPGPGAISTVNRIDYSNDTANAVARGPLTRVKYGNAAASAASISAITGGMLGAASNTGVNRVPVGTDYGYATGGGVSNPYVNYSIVDRIDYSNDTPTATAKGPLTSIRYKHTAVSSLNHAYMVSGNPGPVTDIDRLDYSNDTTVVTKGTASEVKVDLAAAGTTDYGYIAGGLPVSIVQRIEYANDATSTLVRGPLSAARRYLGGMGTQNYGYFGGGSPGPGYMSTIDRIDYSNDSTTAVAKGPLPAILKSMGSTGNGDFGYWTGGFNSVPGSNAWYSTIQRIDYSNDTTSPAPKGALSVGRSTKSTGNTSYGWSLAGNSSNSSPGMLTTVDRIDFSSDTSTAAVKGPLTQARSKVLAAVSSRENNLPTENIYSTTVSSGDEASGTKNIAVGNNFGYFCGGDPAPAGGTLIYRLNFDNDTTAAVTKGNKTVQSRDSQNGASNINYGYIGGGYSPGDRVSTVDRIDYSNDTATALAKGPLDTSSNGVSAAGNRDYSYWVMGRGPGPAGNPYYTNISRVDYSNDTATSTPKGYLTATINYNGCAGNMNAAYFAGGTGPQSTIQRIEYSNDTTTQVRGPLSSARKGAMGAGNADYGYFAAGESPSPGSRSTVDRIDYSNDTTDAVAKGPLDAGMHRDGSSGNASFGYFAPGPSGQPNKRALARIDYSNDTATAVTRGNVINDADYRTGTSPRENGLSQHRLTISTPFAFGENTVSYPYGYYGGGKDGSGSYSTISRVDYTNDTATASVRGPLSAAKKYYYGATGNQSYGYYSGGLTPAGAPSGIVSTVERVDFSNDSIFTSIRGPLHLVRYGMSAAGNNDYGWITGGSPGPLSQVDRIDYANDTTTASPRGNTTVQKVNRGGTGNQSYGYFVGGNPGSVSTTDRIDYSNDTATSVTKGSMPVEKEKWSGAGNKDYGWFSGGTPGPISNVYRLDISNDTASPVEKGPLTSVKHAAGSTGNTFYGYVAGGEVSPEITTIDRIDYSNDTATASVRGNLIQARQQLAGVSAQDMALPQGYPQGTVGTYSSGYFGGGASNPGYNKLSQVDRIDYSNDTATTSIRGPLVAARWYIGATSSPSHGYWIGGKDPSNKTTWVDRIDYANDTSVASERGPISAATYRAMSAVSNDNFAYQGGGNAPSTTSRVHRIDFGNDEVTAVAKGPLIGTRYLLTAVGNKSYGYFAGGNFPGRTDVSRLDYSSDTTACVEKGYLASGRRKLGASGNEDYGYVVGGTSNDTTAIERIDYSNDTATALLRSGMSIRRENFGSTGSYSFGYYAGEGGGKSSTDRLDYTNDTALTVSKGNLSAPIGYQGTGASARSNVLKLFGNILFPKPDLAYSHGGISATETAQTIPVASGIPQQRVPVSERGYFCSGYDYNGMGFNSFVERINFGNDTATAVQKGPIETSGSQLAGTSNSDYGYIGGGPNIPVKTTISRIDYSNDTATGVQRSYLTIGRGDLGGSGNLSYGYMGGGHDFNFGPNIWYSMVDRIDYSNDSATTLAKGPLTVARGYLNSLGNKNYGYWAGGSAPGTKSNIDRLDYANDTTCVAVGPLATSMSRLASVSNNDYGYFVGGNPGTKSTVQRVDFSNDTPTASPKGPMRRGGSHWDGTSNKNYGYMGGGFIDSISPGTPSTSEVERIDFANDTATGLQRGYLTTAKAQMGAAISASANGRG